MLDHVIKQGLKFFFKTFSSPSGFASTKRKIKHATTKGVKLFSTPQPPHTETSMYFRHTILTYLYKFLFT